MNKKYSKKGLLSRSNLPTLTKSESDVLALLSNERLSRNQIALRRKCTRQAVSNIVSNLKRKGALNIVNQNVYKSESTSTHCKANAIRLHGMEFNIKILFKDERYQKLVKKSNVINIDGNTIRLFKDAIEVYSEQSFFGDTPQKSTIEGFKYFDRFMARLEHDLKVILIKPRAQNVRLVNAHYALINNGFAKDCGNKSEHIRIYSTDDGKLWFLIDNSFNLHEAETVHPGTSKQDMQEAVQPFFNDLRDNKPPTLSEMMFLFKGMSEQIMSLNANMEALTASQKISVDTLSTLMSGLANQVHPGTSKQEVESLPDKWKNPITG